MMMQSQRHFNTHGPPPGANSCPTSTTTTSRRDRNSQGAIKDNPSARELLRARPNWTRRLNLLLIAVSLLLGTVAASSSQPGQLHQDDEKDASAIEPLETTGTDDAKSKYPRPCYPKYVWDLKDAAFEYEMRYLDGLLDAQRESGCKTIEDVSKLHNVVYNLKTLNNPDVKEDAKDSPLQLKIYQANILAQGMILAGEFADPDRRPGESVTDFTKRIESVYGPIGVFDEEKEAFDFSKWKEAMITELPLRMKRVVGSIAESNADVVCLQELDLIELFTAEMKKIGYKLVGYQQKVKKNTNCHTVGVMRKLNGKDTKTQDIDGVAIFIKDNGRFEIMEEGRRPCPECEFGRNKAECKVCGGSHEMPRPREDDFDKSGYLGNGGRGYGLPLPPKTLKVDDMNDEWKTPAPHKNWKQIMVHAYIRMVKDRSDNTIDPIDIDVFSFHGKSGDAAKDLTTKAAQVKFCANEIAKIKRRRPNTHVFFPCDFNTHIKNNVNAGEIVSDTHTRFQEHLTNNEFAPVHMTSAYKDVLGEHPEWTCVKTREWPDHQRKVPNQPNKIGTTSNDIDYLGHCDNSVTLTVSDLMAPDSLPKEKYPVTFPSIHAFSDHGRPLVAEFALTRSLQCRDCTLPDGSRIEQCMFCERCGGSGTLQNKKARIVLRFPRRNRKECEDIQTVLGKMKEVKEYANHVDKDIKQRVILREFGRTYTEDYDSLASYTSQLTKFISGQCNNCFATAEVIQKIPGHDKKGNKVTLKKCGACGEDWEAVKKYKAFSVFDKKIKKAGGDLMKYVQGEELKTLKDRILKDRADPDYGFVLERFLLRILETTSDEKLLDYNKVRSAQLAAADIDPKKATSWKDFPAMPADEREFLLTNMQLTMANRQTISWDDFQRMTADERAFLLTDDGRRRLTAEQVLHRRRLAYGIRTSPVLAALMEEIEKAKRIY